MTNIALQSWLEASQSSTIDFGEVHIFCISMKQSDFCIREFSHILSSNEDRKRDRLHFPDDRDRYVIRHGALREILGSYLNIPACDVDIDYAKYGKPKTAENSASSWLQFNLTSSRDLALIAVTCLNHIGVDIEYIIDDFPYMDVASKHFSSGEMKQLNSLPEESRKRAFFDCWTRKEAYIKARGEGLYNPLDRFEVSICPGDRAQLLQHDEDPKEALRWSLQNVDLGSQYAAAFAIEGQVSNYKYWYLS